MGSISHQKKPWFDRALVVVVVVVPALAHGHEREDEAVLAVVGRRVAAPPEHVGERVDGEGAVPEQRPSRRASPRRAPTTPPARKSPTPSATGGTRKQRSSQRSSGYASEILDLALVGRVVLARDDPAHVAPPEAVELGRVHVAGQVGVLVVRAVVRRPPDHALLRRSSSRARARSELHRAARAEAPVREVAVVPRRHAEHAHVVEDDREEEPLPRPARATHTPITAATCTRKNGTARGDTRWSSGLMADSTMR